MPNSLKRHYIELISISSAVDSTTGKTAIFAIDKIGRPWQYDPYDGSWELINGPYIDVDILSPQYDEWVMMKSSYKVEDIRQ